MTPAATLARNIIQINKLLQESPDNGSRQDALIRSGQGNGGAEPVVDAGLRRPALADPIDLIDIFNCFCGAIDLDK